MQKELLFKKRRTFKKFNMNIENWWWSTRIPFENLEMNSVASKLGDKLFLLNMRYPSGFLPKVVVKVHQMS
jgi:hypothetical protein